MSDGHIKPPRPKTSSKKALVRELAVKGTSTVAKTTFVSPEDRVPKVATYVRVSTQGQAELGNAEVQKGQVERLFREYYKDDKHLVGRYVDEGYNLTRYEPERQIWKLMEDVALGKVNVIICAFSNRVFRSSDQGLQGKIIQILNDRTVTVIDQNKKIVFDPSNSSNSLVTAVEAGLGVVDKAITVNKLQKARRFRMKDDEFYVPSILPFGYDAEIDPLKKSRDRDRKKIVAVKDEFALIEDIYRLYLGEEPKSIPPLKKPANGKHLSDKMIAEHLNSLGLTRQNYIARTHKGLKASPEWTMSAITYILTKPTYMGKMTVTFRETAEGGLYRAPEESRIFEVPAAVTGEAWERVQKIREKIHSLHAQRLNPLHHQQSYWLHDKIVCRICGKKLKGRTSSTLIRYYRCEGKRKPGDEPHDNLRAIDAESMIESFLRPYVEVATNLKSYDQIIAKLLSESTTDTTKLFVERRLAALRQRLVVNKTDADKLFAWLEKGIVDEERYVEKNRELKASRLEIEKEIEKEEAEIVSFSLKETKTDAKRDLEAAFRSAGSPDNSRLKILQLLALSLIAKVEVHRMPALDLKELSLEQIRHHYMMGRLTVSRLVAEGWTIDKIHRRLGRSGRKNPLDWTLVMTDRGGGIKEFFPAPNYMPAALVPAAVKREERQEAATEFSSQPIKLAHSIAFKEAVEKQGDLLDDGAVSLIRWGSRIPERAISIHRLQDPRYLEARAKFDALKKSLEEKAVVTDAADIGGKAEPASLTDFTEQRGSREASAIDGASGGRRT